MTDKFGCQECNEKFEKMSLDEFADWKASRKSSQESLSHVDCDDSSNRYKYDDEITIYRENSQNNKGRVWWTYIRIIKNGSKAPAHRESTGTHIKKTAIEFAIKARDLLKGMDERGIKADTVKKSPFEDCASRYITALEQELGNGQGNTSNEKIISTLKNWIIPYFKSKDLKSIETADLYDFYDLADPPDSPTQRRYQILAIAGVFKHALRQRRIKEKPAFPQLKDIRVSDPDRRWEPFNQEDLKLIISSFDDFAESAPSALSRYYRRAAKYYFDFCLSTGVRPGEEPEGIQFKHIFKRVDPDNGKEFFQIQIHNGKTNRAGIDYRTIIIDDNAVSAIENAFARLRQEEIEEEISENQIDSLEFLIKNNKEDYPFRRLSNGKTPPYAEIISKNQLFNYLEKDLISSGYVRYSTRHTYINSELRKENPNPNRIADHCGTSLTMIDRHYKRIQATIKIPENMQENIGNRERKSSLRESLLDREGTKTPEQLRKANNRLNSPEARANADEFWELVTSYKDEE